MDAAEVLRRIGEVYANARAYVDTGIVTTTFIHPNRRTIRRLPFKTAFERPHRFRYEFEDEDSGHRLVIWQDVPPAKLFWTVTGEVETRELSMAIAAATGVSGGSAFAIPRLLIGDLFGGAQGPTDLEEASHLGEEVIDGVRCLSIQGRRGANPVTLSVGADDLLVRRIFETHHFGPEQRARTLADLPEEMRPRFAARAEDFDTETETLYTPRANLDLTPTAFDPGV
jgi:hypothetical protein